MVECLGDEVVCWFDRFDRKQPASIVLLCLASLQTSPLVLKPVFYITKKEFVGIVF